MQDFYGSVELTIFEKTLLALEGMDREIPIAVKCFVQEKNDTKSLRAEKSLTLEEAQKEKVEVIMQKADTREHLVLLLSAGINEMIFSSIT